MSRWSLEDCILARANRADGLRRILIQLLLHFLIEDFGAFEGVPAAKLGHRCAVHGKVHRVTSATVTTLDLLSLSVRSGGIVTVNDLQLGLPGHSVRIFMQRAVVAELAQRLTQRLRLHLLLVERGTRFGFAAHSAREHGATAGCAAVLHGVRLERQEARVDELLIWDGRCCLLVLGHHDYGVFIALSKYTRRCHRSTDSQCNSVMVVAGALLHLGTWQRYNMRRGAFSETFWERAMARRTD